VATVDNLGNIRARGSGTADITATCRHGNASTTRVSVP
jgi:hypothetical protein